VSQLKAASWGHCWDAGSWGQRFRAKALSRQRIRWGSGNACTRRQLWWNPIESEPFSTAGQARVLFAQCGNAGAR
jgi:hypothetical protein